MWWIVILLFYVCECLVTFQAPEMCKPDNSDCSFQVPNSTEGSCLVYNSTVCRNYDFSDWVLSSVEKLTSESDAPFSVFVMPYALDKIHSNFLPERTSAINVTFTILQEGVSGFEIFLYDNASAFNLCRIFDFRNANRHMKVPINFFYDCIWRLVERNYQNVTMTFRAFPMNVELSYYISIPHLTQYLSTDCTWKPLFMIFAGSLLKHTVHLKFSQMPKSVNISSYTVKLLSYSSNEESKMLVVPASSINNLLSAEFSSVNEGYFYISITVVTTKGIFCDDINSRAFYVGYNQTDKAMFFYLYIVLLVGLVIIAFIFIYYWLFTPGLISSKRRLLLGYSYDCAEHESLVKAFQAYLEKHCNLVVNTIYGKSGNPNDWLKEQYNKSDIIMFIISEGLFHAIEHKNIPPLREGHHWKNQLSVAEIYVSTEMFNLHNPRKNKKFCTIAFSYSGNQHIPYCLKESVWQNFALPEEMNNLLCFIFNYKFNLPCTNILFQMPGHDVNSFEEGKELIKKINDMKKVVSKGLHIQYVKDKYSSEAGDLVNNSVLNAYVSNKNDFACDDYKNFNSVDSFLATNNSEKVNQHEENDALLNPSDFSLSQVDEDLRILVRQDLHSKFFSEAEEDFVENSVLNACVKSKKDFDSDDYKNFNSVNSFLTPNVCEKVVQHEKKDGLLNPSDFAGQTDESLRILVRQDLHS